MIDQPGAIDRDDAIWVAADRSGWQVRVHVAHVARVVALGSAADVAACRRGQTLYLPERTVPMLAAAEEAAAALRPGHSVPTCLITLRVDRSGELTETTIEQTQLADPVAVSYQEAAAALDDSGHRLHRLLRDAYEVARTLLERRRAAGALAAYDLTRGWATDEDGRIVRLGAPERNAGYLIVQELMIAANQAAARWAQQRQLPLLFRNHRAGSVSREELNHRLRAAADRTGDSDAEVDRWLAEVAAEFATGLRPAVYEPWVAGHFGLNLPAYAHVTSPLRRYPDLVNQRILLAAAAGRPIPYQIETLQEVAAAVNLRQEGQRARRSAALRSAAHRQVRAQLADRDYQSLDDDSFGKLVRLAVTEGRFSRSLAEELERRLSAGTLLPREAATVLLELPESASGQSWAPVRQQVLAWLAEAPGHALTVLTLHAQRAYGGSVRWQEEPVGTVRQPAFTATAVLGEHRSPARVAPSKRAARQQAALALVAQLARLPDPSADIGVDEAPRPARQRVIPPGHPPVMAVNELAQMGRLAELSWMFAASGTPHEPVHTCTVTAYGTTTGVRYTGTGSGSTKAAAKSAAAQALWEQLSAE
jgi:ribonuclease R